MHREGQLSSTHEMYLKVVFGLARNHRVARVRDMAEGLGVRPGTVSAVLKKLETAGLVRHERYGEVTLTAAGTEVAECILRRFETIRAILVELFGIDEEAAEVDACMMEHAVSPMTVNRMERLLELLRTGKLAAPQWTASRRRLQTAQCAECEVTGVCQAEARAELR